MSEGGDNVRSGARFGTASALVGSTITLNGDRWTVVDVAPAEPLAEMTAGILEEEGFVVVVRPADPTDDVYAHLGASRVGATVVLVPEGDAERATQLIAETVTDYQGNELEAMLASGEGWNGSETPGDDAGDEDDGTA